MDKNGNLRIALAQINPTVGDFKKNISKVITAIGHAKEKDTDIVTFPEFVICGYPPEDLLLKPQFIKDNKKVLSQVIKKTGGITALVGFADSQNGRVYNAAAVISDTHLVGTYYKVELPNYGVFDEMRYFSPGSECIVLDQNNVRCIVTICEDIWIEGGKPEQWAVKNKVKIIFNISASPFHAGKLALRRRMLIKLAKRTKTFVCYNNLVGGQDELVFDGGSLIVSPEGELMATGKSFQEDLVIADVEIKDLPLQPSLKVACKECQHIVLKSKRYENRKAINAPFAEELGRIEEVYEAIVTGTRDYVLK